MTALGWRSVFPYNCRIPALLLRIQEDSTRSLLPNLNQWQSLGLSTAQQFLFVPYPRPGFGADQIKLGPEGGYKPDLQHNPRASLCFSTLSNPIQPCPCPIIADENVISRVAAGKTHHVMITLLPRPNSDSYPKASDG